jgi:hypothetical protein
MRMDRIAPVMIAAAVAMPLAACGGSSSGGGGGAAGGGAAGSGGSQTSASSYVHQICLSISGFEKNVTAGEQSLNALSSSGSPDLSKLKSKVGQFFSSAAKASDTARTQIDKAGTPAVQNGAKIRTALLTAFQSFSTSFNTAAKQSKALDANNPKKFQAATVKLQQQLQQTSQGVSSTLNGLGTSLDAAAKKDTACAAIEGGAAAPQ